MKRAAIVGSRSIVDYRIIKEILDKHDFDQVVSGGAKGVDSLAEEYSQNIGLLKPLVFLPDWKKHGRGAGFIRNKDIIDHSDIVIAIWDGKSKGTVNSINHAHKQNKPVFVYVVTEEGIELS